MKLRKGFAVAPMFLVLSSLFMTLPQLFSGSYVPVSSVDDFVPSMKLVDGADRNHDGIEDSFQQEIAARLRNGTGQELVNVVVMLRSQPTARDNDVFVASGGILTTGNWKYAIYGFGGRIPHSRVGVFVKRDPNVLLVEKEAVGNACLAYAATQVGARPYVWITLALQGDPNSSLAVIDSGIDASHVDFAPSYGNLDFSKKIVGWIDEINSGSAPYDDLGHGSHCAGLAAGDGFFSVDSSGYATVTWGANLGAPSSGAYLAGGMMVNKTGTITVKFKWKNMGTAKPSALQLYYGDKTLSPESWTQVNSTSTPDPNTWYNLTYNVASTPSGGYDMYHVQMNLAAGNGSLYTVFTMSWPYTPPADDFPAWTGIAPQTKLVGVKVLSSWGTGTSTEVINGIEWVIANKMTYHITVASMSLAFYPEDIEIGAAVANLVNSGVATVVAAGNLGSGGNNIYTPGSVDEVITVAAMNQFDGIANYSSEGGISHYLGHTVKPDVTAPGGSYYAVPLFSADSNEYEPWGEGFEDVQPNDAAPWQGTSMATPIVAGGAEILVQALGGSNAWKYTKSQALLPKMLLLMTATETYPNARESGTSPTLERGGKDAQEGYGRVNIDAAADAVLKSYYAGTTVEDSLGSPPTLGDISGLGQRLCWARNVQLASGFTYNFTLTVPAGADFDLYLYNSSGNAYGEPIVLAKSTSTAAGAKESMVYTPVLSGEYYVVVKRARADTGHGQFTLTSERAIVGGNWLSGWSYRKSLIVSTGLHIITVHYDSGNDVLGHTYLNGACQADFGDIRFASSDGATLIGEVAVRTKVEGDYAEFRLDVSGSPIYLYYGNLVAPALYEDEVLSYGSLGETAELTQNWTVPSGEGQISGIARASPITGFATSLEAEIGSDVGSTARMALLLVNGSLEQVGYPNTVYGKRIVAFTETKSIPVSSRHREVFEFEKPVPIFKGTVYGIALWAGAGTKYWYTLGAGVWSFFVDGGFGAVGDLVQTGELGTCALGRFMNYGYYPMDEDEQNVLFRDNADYTRSRSMWQQHYETNGTIDAEAGLGIGGSYAFNSTISTIVPAINGTGWGELAFKGEIGDGNRRFWSGVVRLSALPDLGHHSDLMAVVRFDPWRSLNGFGVDRTEAGVQWRLSMQNEAGVWSHTLFGEVQVDTDYSVILSYETYSGDAKSEVWVTKLGEPDLLEEASPSATLTLAANAFGDLFFIGAADYPLRNVSAISAFFDEMTLTEGFPATFGAWGAREGNYAYLQLGVEPNQATYKVGQSLAVTVNIFNPFTPVLETTLTFTVTGPGEYYFFDFQRVTVAANSVDEYTFDWIVPDAAGTYVVEVSLIPPRLTAYDAAWLEAT